jgi:hypothetical protein
VFYSGRAEPLCRLLSLGLAVKSRVPIADRS